MQVHTSEILDSQKYITYRLREIYYFYVCLSDGNRFTGDIHSAWAACVYGTTGSLVIIQSTGAVTNGTHGYEEACQLFVYIPQQLHVSYILKRIEVFFFIVVVNNNDND